MLDVILVCRSLLGFSFAFALALPAQCTFDWDGGYPPSGPSGQVAAIVQLPNGDLVAAGSFRYAGTQVVDNLTRWNGSEWLPLGSPDGVVQALAVAANGDLYVGGGFATIGGIAAARIARFDGATWHPLGSGMDGWVNGLLVSSTGDLYAGGNFDHAGGVPAVKVARWNGATWAPLGTGIQGVFVGLFALAERPNGDIVVAGTFASAGGVPADSAARWDGSSWSSLGMPGGGYAQAIVALPNGDIAIGSTLGVWSSNGVTAQPLGYISGAYRLRIAANGDLLFGGGSSTGPAGTVARWDGTTWTPFGGGAPVVRDFFELPNGDIVSGGGLTGPIEGDARAVHRWNGTSWSPIGNPPPPQAIAGMVRTKAGEVVVGGTFPSLGGVAVNHVAKWHGTTWVPLGLGVGGPVTRVAADPGGGVVVGGSFTTAGGAPANGIARWDGTSWSPLGSGMPLAPLDLAVAPNGDVFAVYSPTSPPAAIVITWWNGAVWQLLPYYVLMPGRIAVLPDGRLVAHGLLGGMGAWDGVSWTAMPSPGNYISDLEVLPDGSLFALGTGPVQRWNGTGWQTLGPGQLQFAFGIAQLPNGDPVIAGQLPGLARGVCRWNGSSWQSLGTAGPAMGVERVVAADDGDLFVSGTFQEFAGDITFRLALGVPTCRAEVTPFGSGCAGSVGPLELTTADRPWVGTTLTTLTTGIAGSSIAVQSVGWNPLARPLAGGFPGCVLLVQAEWFDTLSPLGSTVTANLAIPNTPALAGAAFGTQTIVFEFGPGFTLLGTASSSALAFVVGAL